MLMGSVQESLIPEDGKKWKLVLTSVLSCISFPALSVICSLGVLSEDFVSMVSVVVSIDAKCWIAVLFGMEVWGAEDSIFIANIEDIIPGSIFAVMCAVIIAIVVVVDLVFVAFTLALKNVVVIVFVVFIIPVLAIVVNFFAAIVFQKMVLVIVATWHTPTGIKTVVVAAMIVAIISLVCVVFISVIFSESFSVLVIAVGFVVVCVKMIVVMRASRIFATGFTPVCCAMFIAIALVVVVMVVSWTCLVNVLIDDTLDRGSC